MNQKKTSSLILKIDFDEITPAKIKHVLIDVLKTIKYKKYFDNKNENIFISYTVC
ncbi:MAG TPA: hypothetical protein V6C58_14120 [Allocoleopsis sp.]